MAIDLRPLFKAAARILGDVDYQDFRADVMITLEGYGEQALERAGARVALEIESITDDMLGCAGLDAAQSGAPSILAVYAIEAARGDVTARGEFFEACGHVAALSAVTAFFARLPFGSEITEEILGDAEVESIEARANEEDAQAAGGAK